MFFEKLGKGKAYFLHLLKDKNISMSVSDRHFYYFSKIYSIKLPKTNKLIDLSKWAYLYNFWLLFKILTSFLECYFQFFFIKMWCMHNGLLFSC